MELIPPTSVFLRNTRPPPHSGLQARSLQARKAHFQQRTPLFFCSCMARKFPAFPDRVPLSSSFLFLLASCLSLPIFLVGLLLRAAGRGASYNEQRQAKVSEGEMGLDVN